MLLLRDAILRRPRSFRADALTCISLLTSPPDIKNPENIPAVGPWLLVTNHYSRPGFPAWWIALGISAAVPDEIHWLMTAAWTHLGPLAPITQWLFPHFAKVYNFTTTPPMPPTPWEMEARAHAVRRVLRYARTTPSPVIGIAPEGRDNLNGELGKPPSGVGRFIEKLMPHCQRIVPSGVYENKEKLCINFGQAFQLETHTDFSVEQRDLIASEQVMRAIAQQLPSRMRGAYGP
jgi:hypothetical protein